MTVKAKHGANAEYVRIVEILAGVAKEGDGGPLGTVARLVAEAGTRRERLPDTRDSTTRGFHVKGGAGEEPLRMYVTASTYPDGRPGEIFVRCDKQGSLLAGFADAVAMSISIGLQHGVPLGAYTSKLIGSRFEPAGFTGDKAYPSCTSVLDLIGRWLRDRFEKGAAA